MNEQKHTSPDDLTKTNRPADVQLNEEDLGKVAGGAVDYFLQLNGIQGESQDPKPSKS